MSATAPITDGSRARGRDGRPSRDLPTRLLVRAEELASRRNAQIVLVLAGVVALAVFFLRPTYPNYDSYYTLLWGSDLAAGRLPDYDVFRTPTPHPLATLIAAALSPLGESRDRVFVLIILASWVALLAALFRLTQLLLGSFVAIVALAVLLTRTDLEFFALRGIVDIPFLALVFIAAVLELRRPRRGPLVLGLLALAGLLRPEAWVLAGAYVLWLAPRVPRRRLVAYGALAAAAPLLWAIADWIVTGNPLYSLTSTREVAGQFQRQRSVFAAIALIPDYIGANEKIVNVGAGGLGGLLALWLLRARAALPLALMGIGIGIFLAIAAVGLSVIPRYLVVPSLILNLCVAVALTGWVLVRDRRARKVALAVLGVALLLLAWRVPAYFKDLQHLNGQTLFVREQHRQLKQLLHDARVTKALRSCGPLTVATHSVVPVIRYETGLPKQAFRTSIAQNRPPRRGLLLIGKTANFEPSAARAAVGDGLKSALRWWSNYPLSTFHIVAANDRWRLYQRCGPRA